MVLPTMNQNMPMAETRMSFYLSVDDLPMAFFLENLSARKPAWMAPMKAPSSSKPVINLERTGSTR
jgi:hypothetical protein